MLLHLVQNIGTWTRREFSSQKNLQTFLSVDPMGHWSIHLSSPVCTCNLPSVLNALTEKDLAFSNREKEWTGSTFLIDYRAIATVFIPLKEYVVHKLSLNRMSSLYCLLPQISFNSKSTRAICFLFIFGKFGTFHWKRILMNDIA